MDQIAHDVRLQQWAQLIQECNASGGSKKQWCQDRNISLRQFYYWQRRIRRVLYEKIAPDEETTALVKTSPSSTVPECVELTLPVLASDNRREKPLQPDVVVQVAGMTISVSNTVSPALLRQILEFCHAG